MGNTKKTIIEFLIFIFLAIFPLGQIIGINLGDGLRFHPIDLVAILTIPFVFRKAAAVVMSFLPVFLGNLIWLSQGPQSLIGLLYLLRLFSFIAFFFCIKQLVFVEKKYIEVIPKILIYESLIIGILGFLQYLYLPNFKSFVEWGWDDHLYRLIGTFLDPGFTGIILCLGFILSFFTWQKTKNMNYLLISLFLMMSLAFTYSRASMLSLISAMGLIIFFTKQIKLFTLVILFGLVVFMLPRPASEGVELERVASISSRIENYKETSMIFQKNPVFGVGINNLCEARIKYFQNNTQSSHSCSGSDSSILFVLSTIGVVGTLIIIKFLIHVLKSFDLKKSNNQIIFTSGVSLLIHSQFANSLLYPWVLGWFCLLLGSLSAKAKTPKVSSRMNALKRSRF